MPEAVALLRLALVAALIAAGVVGYRRTRNAGFALLPAVIVGWPFVRSHILTTLDIEVLRRGGSLLEVATATVTASLLEFALFTFALYLLGRRRLSRRG